MTQAIAMIQLTIDAKHKGVGMAVFLGVTGVFGSIGIFLVGYLQKEFKVET